MKEDWENAEGPRERRTLKRIDVLSKEIERLEGILNDFLTYARGFSLQLVPANLNSIINEMVTFVDPEARRHGIEIRVFTDPSLSSVSVDLKYIRLALMNILQNALQALEDKEGIKDVLIRTRTVPGGVEIVMTDTGSGIALEHRDKIFHVYFSTKRGGTGLGLPMVKRIVKEHDGTVSFQSEEGKGTSFSIFLPAGGPE